MKHIGEPGFIEEYLLEQARERDAEIKAERDEESQPTLFDDWKSDNIRSLKDEFCEENYDSFNEYCKEQFKEWKESK